MKKFFFADVWDQIQQALGNITEGLCHPLKSRIEHIVAVDAPATVLYSVTTLLRYYQSVLEPTIENSVLDNTMKDLLDLSEKSFISRLQKETRAALGDRVERPNTNLIPTASVARLLSLLNEVLSVASIAEDREKDMLQIVSCIIDPLLQEINETAARLPTVDMAVYLLNCIHQIQTSLALYEYMDQRLERLQVNNFILHQKINDLNKLEKFNYFFNYRFQIGKLIFTVYISGTVRCSVRYSDFRTSKCLGSQFKPRSDLYDFAKSRTRRLVFYSGNGPFESQRIYSKTI